MALELDLPKPLPTLFADDSVTEILVNRWDRIFVERDGVRQASGLRFESAERLRYAVERILDLAPGARADISQPMVDLALPDGSRVNICVPPVVLDSPHLTIRKYNRPVTVPEDLVGVGTLSPEMAWFLATAVRHGAAVLYSGATGTGKTTMLEVLASAIDHRERIVVIEDTLELHLPQPNVVRMLGRPANMEGKGEISLEALFRNSLRMRPSRILLGEIRGGEVLDYLQAITSGHRGCQAIVHASSAREAVLRLQQLALMAGRGADRNVVAQQVVQGLDLVVQLDQHHDGVRRTVAITEVYPDAASPLGVGLRDIYVWRQPDVAAGQEQGTYTATGHRPLLADSFELEGLGIPKGAFVPGGRGDG